MTTTQTNLLDQIMAMGDDAFVAWEKLCSEYDPTDFAQLDLGYLGLMSDYGKPFIDNFDLTPHNKNAGEKQAVVLNGRYMAVWLPGPNVWVPRETPAKDDNAVTLGERCAEILDQYAKKQ